jgi:microcystin-dependent protein
VICMAHRQLGFMEGLTSINYMLNELYGQIGSLIRAFSKLREAQIPVGGVVEFAGSTAPSGFLFCDGSAVSRTTYAALFAVLGTMYGAGDGTTTFSLPNMKGRVPVGLNPDDGWFNELGETGGAKEQSFGAGSLVAAIGAISGDANKWGYEAVTKNSSAPNSSMLITATGEWPPQSHVFGTHTRVVGSTAAGSVMNPYVVLNYIIKT